MNKLSSGKFMQRDVEFPCEFAGKKINRIKSYNDKIFIGAADGFYYTKKDGSFGSFNCDDVDVIFAAKDKKVYFASGNELYVYSAGKIKKLQSFDDKITGIDGDDEIYLITEYSLYHLENGEFVRFLGNDMPSYGLAVSNGKIRSFSGRRLTVFAGKRPHWMCIYPEHTDMPDFSINAIKIDASTGFVWLGTDKGLCVYDDGACWYMGDKIDALPRDEIYDIAFGEKGEMVLASAAGVIILNKGSKKYLPASRYVPVSRVNTVEICGNKIYAGTDEGLSVISENEMTLEEKAEYYFDICEKYFIRKDGYTAEKQGIINRDITTGKTKITDNDGLWTQLYIAALSYKYAVTKDKKALEAARRSMLAMIKLTEISGIPGFTARAVRYPGEEGYGTNIDSSIEGCEWHKAPDGVTEWLGETSSDEMTGHFFGFSLYYDLCADKKEKELIKNAICNIVDHILKNNYRLIDKDGLPTTWACWTPSELNGNNMWQWEKCVNSLEILSFLNVAYHMSGDEKYRKEFLRLAINEKYLINASHHKKDDGRVTHIDDNLAFLCTVNMLRLEKDERIKSYIYMGMKNHFDYERNEGFAFWNLIYGAFTGDVCDIDTAVKYLQLMPLNLTDSFMFNSMRKDLIYDTEQEKWGGIPQLKKPLDIDERSYLVFSSNPYYVDDGCDERAVSPANFLLPYWFGRYYGMIE